MKFSKGKYEIEIDESTIVNDLFLQVENSDSLETNKLECLYLDLAVMLTIIYRVLIWPHKTQVDSMSQIMWH